ncbi:CLC_0170 family protein [uncultured Clostridium sp.]|uniref:CLC_0170 family protein n=1 Tax=uncultured Clostridium sp. TaxID=59620 RepID=UPI0028EEEEFE|nr:CLC_0170 family protein [uncultured Clostridium sp.]
MYIIKLFDKYLLMLVAFQAFVAIFIDSISFKRANMLKSAKQIKLIGIIMFFVTLMLYIISKIYY